MNTHLTIQSELKAIAPPRVAVVRALPGLGDLLCGVPALRSLRRSFPSAEVTLIGLPNALPFVQRFHAYVDQFLEFPGFPGMPEVPVDGERLRQFLDQAQALKFDLALQLHGSGVCTNAFTQLLNASLTAGCYPVGGHCPNANFFMPYPESQPEIWRSLRLLEFLGIPSQGDSLEFPLMAQDWQNWKEVVSRYSLPREYVCVHPGASVPERRWALEHFATVADRLARSGLSVVLTGSAAERELTQAVADRMQSKPMNLAGCTSLGALAILLKGAKLLICNDTGVSHLAAALRVKSVVLFSHSDSQRWAPLDRQLHRVVQVAGQARSQDVQVSSSIIQCVLAETFSLLEMEFQYAS